MKRLLRSFAVASALSLSTVAAPALAGEPAVAQPQTGRPKLDVVFVLDTTSSMAGLIEGAKQKIWSIASRMASGTPTPEIRVGLVAFRDRGDAYVTKRFDLTKDLDAVYANLKTLNADGGGDTPEHVGRGLGEAVKLMSWTDDKKAAKLIFLVGDAPAHDDYRDEWNLEAWTKQAIAKGIVVNTIRCGTDEQTAQVFRKVAKLADGTFISLDQGGGMVAVATPFDAELSKMNAELASKTLVAGARRSRGLAEGKLAAMKTMAAAEASDRLAYNAKMAPAARGASSVAGDFGEAIDLTAQPERLGGLKDEELPEALRAVDKDKRAAFLAEQAKEKQALEARIVEVARKRDTWISTNAKKTTSFDDKVMESVAAQAAPAGIAY